MTIYVLGINHKTASVQLREKAYFAADKMALYLHDLMSQGFAKEAVILSTCNRSELYCHADNLNLILEWFSTQTSLTRAELNQALIPPWSRAGYYQ